MGTPQWKMGMKGIVWREMTQEDIEGVAALEQASFAAPWSAQSFREELENKLAYYLLGFDETALIAYAGMWIIFDEAHITNVAVASSYRGKGVGKDLMREMFLAAKERKAASMTLEVRPSNVAALALYEKLGFARAGLRKNYYEDTHEDAVIMWLRALPS